ncbi:DUF3592 domain-containing protein [Nocardia sp. BMG111209]|uniref:DUF3592 domain-containing protein n=1 Tax=Nocardia sp. BMG111209 TaxID=1160137 RepID=UPI0003605BC4|nr:DUF3592 domain-containing protein [Nocardia sp. BMG111209]
MQLVWKFLSCAFLAGFGIVLIYIGFRSVRETLERLSLWRRGHRADGVLVSVDEESDSDSKPQYRLTVEFVTATGERRRAALPDPVRSRRRIGQRLTVLYRPDDRTHVVALDLGARFLSVLFFPILMVSGLISVSLAVEHLLGFEGFTLWNHILSTRDIHTN